MSINREVSEGGVLQHLVCHKDFSVGTGYVPTVIGFPP